MRGLGTKKKRNGATLWSHDEQLDQSNINNNNNALEVNGNGPTAPPFLFPFPPLRALVLPF